MSAIIGRDDHAAAERKRSVTVVLPQDFSSSRCLLSVSGDALRIARQRQRGQRPPRRIGRDAHPRRLRLQALRHGDAARPPRARAGAISPPCSSPTSTTITRGGVARFARRYDLPVYLTYGTLVALGARGSMMPRVSLIDSHTPFAIGDLEVHPYPGAARRARAVAVRVQRRRAPAGTAHRHGRLARRTSSACSRGSMRSCSSATTISSCS